MGFVTTTSPSDTLTGLINLLADPQASVNKLQEIKDAMADFDKRTEEVVKAETELKAKQDSFEIDQRLIEQERKELEVSISKMKAATKDFQDKTVLIDKARQELKDLRKELFEEHKVAMNEVQEKKAENKTQENALFFFENELKLRENTLDQRENVLKDREERAAELVEEYKQKLAKLKDLMDKG